MNFIKIGLIIAFMIWVLFSIGKSDAYAETETTADVTENSAGATTSCAPRCSNWNFDPRTDIQNYNLCILVNNRLLHQQNFQ